MPRIRLSLSIRAKVVLLFATLIGLSIVSSGLVYQRIAGVEASVGRQAQGIAGQRAAIAEQAGLIGRQRALGAYSERVSVAQQYLAAMQYWYFHAALNADRESLAKAEQVATRLVDELEAMVAADPALADRIAGMKKVVDQYQRVGGKMFEFLEKSMMLMGRSMAEVAREEAVKLSEGLDGIRSDYQQRELQLTQGVLDAGIRVRAASDQVAASGDEIRTEVERAGSLSLVMAAVLVIAAVLLGTLFLYSLIGPIRRLGRKIADIQDNNDLTGTLGYHRNDELTVVTRAFDQMLARFGDLIGQVAGSTTDLGDVAAKGRASSQNLNEQVGRQQQETNLVASAANQVTATAQGVRRNADAAASLSDEVSDLTGDGGRSADESANAMAMLEERIEKVFVIMSELADRSASIGRVVDVIRGISEKTNLLALNAAIEAARAGEMGRGFAIVADEVRGLARQTADSTGEIDDLVKALQQEARRAVDTVELSRQDSRVTVERIQACSESLVLIDSKAKEMRILNQEVAQAAAEQSDAVSSIDENLINLKSQIEEISGNARNTDLMTDRLASLSEVLRGHVQQFRY